MELETIQFDLDKDLDKELDKELKEIKEYFEEELKKKIIKIRLNIENIQKHLHIVDKEILQDIIKLLEINIINLSNIWRKNKPMRKLLENIYHDTRNLAIYLHNE
jgi:hypothetical protein